MISIAALADRLHGIHSLSFQLLTGVFGMSVWTVPYDVSRSRRLYITMQEKCYGEISGKLRSRMLPDHSDCKELVSGPD